MILCHDARSPELITLRVQSVKNALCRTIFECHDVDSTCFPGRRAGAWQRHETVLCLSNHHRAQREKRPIAAAAAIVESITCPQRSGPRTVVHRTSISACFDPLAEACSCLKEQNSGAKNRSAPLHRLSEPIPCDVPKYLCFREHESCLTPHIPPARRATDCFASFFLVRRLRCIRFMLWLSLHE